MAEMRYIGDGRSSSGNLTSLRRHAVVGLIAVILLAGGLGWWAATTDIAGAVISSGTVVLGSGSKPVQHAEGGIVAEVLVEDGDYVETGDLLARFEGTAVRANVAVINSQLAEAFARQARLRAETTDQETIDIPAAMENIASPDEIAAMFGSQQDLLISRRAAIDNQIVRIEERIGQIERQIAGLESQLQSASDQLEIISRQVEEFSGLLSQGLVQSSRVDEFRREQSRLIGEEGRIVADIAVARAGIVERRAEIDQTRNEFQSQALQNLQDVSAIIAEYLQQKIAAEDRLARLEVRAPVPGVVHELAVRDAGAVVGVGQILMLIVPQEEEMHVEARVNPQEIGRIFEGQDVRLQFASLNARTTPTLYGIVERLSPDLVLDPLSRQSYYSVRIAIGAGELDRLPEGARLSAGMPVSVYAQTGERTVLDYLVKPLTDQISHAFREE
jgi:HlyD family secretion protein